MIESSKTMDTSVAYAVDMQHAAEALQMQRAS
jgi:hypothetical protein